MGKSFIILLTLGIIFYFYRRRLQKNSSKQKSNKVGETMLHRTKKNKPKVHLEAEDIEFEEIKKYED